MTTQQQITNSDLWAAVRGLGMHGMTRSELQALAAEHSGKALFASRVIAEAARQVASTKRKGC